MALHVYETADPRTRSSDLYVAGSVAGTGNTGKKGTVNYAIGAASGTPHSAPSASSLLTRNTRAHFDCEDGARGVHGHEPGIHPG